MDRLKLFAENLRRECARHGSIASVCRKAQVNRQQFNKYLAGRSMPSAAVLQRICSTLDLKLDVLFAEVQTSSRPETGSFEARFHNLTVGLFGSAIDKYRSGSVMRAGNYYCYFPLHRVSGTLVRTFIQVREEGNVSSFTRLTSIRDGKTSTGMIAKGRHRGLVMSNGSDIYLVGINRYAPYQLSVMSINSNSTLSNNQFFGSIMTRSGSSQLNSNFCMVPIPSGTTLRQIRNSLGTVDEAEVPTESLLLSTMKAPND